MNINQKKQRRIAAGVVALGLVLAFSAYSWRLYQNKQQALAQAEGWEPGESGLAGDNLAKEDGKEIQFEGKTYVRNTYVKAILCMGVDRKGSMSETTRAGAGGQADGIFLVAQDTARDKVKVLMIPRDTMTHIMLTDLQGNELGKEIQHLTLAYGYGDGREKSCRYMSQAVSELLGGLHIDGYAAVSMSALPLINDSVGGVPVTVEDPDLADRDPGLVPGETVVLKGDQAETYLRYRDIEKSQSALTRMERQKQYIESFSQAAINQAQKEDGFAARLLEEITPYMVTNLSKDQYLKLALAFFQEGQALGEEDMMTLPGKAAETDRYDEYHPDRDQIQRMILDLFYRVEDR